MKENKLIVLLVILIIVLVGVFGYFIYKMQINEKIDEKTTSDKVWHAVFLSNGQVYFGHLTNVTDQYVTLKNIYYLQVQKNLQPPPEGEERPEEQKLSLIKLGNELHGPTDQMNINRDHVLFYEELKDDSRVVRAIKEYEAGK